MGTRANSMATIDAVLTGVPLQSTPTNTTQSPAAPHPAPGVEVPTPLTADEKRGYDVARQSRLDAEKKEKDIVAANEAAAQQELAQQQLAEQQQQSLYDKGVNAAGKIVKNTSVTLERIPTPGSLAVPLIVLAAFFFLLIPINGHTRFTWLWLVLTGNAHIGTGGPAQPIPGANGASGDFNEVPFGPSKPIPGANGASGDFNYTPFVKPGASGAPALMSSLPNFSFTLPMMTGAEDFL